MEEIIKKQMEILEAVGTEAKNKWDLVEPHTIIALYKEVNKDLRVAQMKKEREERDLKPSSKQINYAKDLGIPDPEKYSKEELSKMIEEKIGKK